MHKTHIFDQKNNAKKNVFTDLPTLFFSDRYRKQTIYFLRPCEILFKRNISKIVRLFFAPEGMNALVPFAILLVGYRKFSEI